MRSIEPVLLVTHRRGERRQLGTEIAAAISARGHSANLVRHHGTGVSAAGYRRRTPVLRGSPEFSAERLRDYVAAFVLAGLDKNVGAEADFLPIASSTTTKV